MRLPWTGVLACALVACGGLLGIGEDDDAPDTAPLDASVDDALDDASDDLSVPDDAGDDVALDAIAAADAALDVIDVTPNDAGPNVLVLARFEQSLVGGDGADVASSMTWTSKSGAIRDAHSAETAANPSYVAWSFAAPSTIYVSFSIVIVALPSNPGGEIARVTGAGETASIVVGSNGAFAVRTGGGLTTGGKMQVGVAYRVGMVLDHGASTVSAGFAPDGAMPVAGIAAPWTPGVMSNLLLGATGNQSLLAVRVDDVLVSTKGLAP